MENSFGKAKGGIKKNALMTIEQKKDHSLKMVAAKKEKASLPKTICGDEDKRIVFGDIEIQCFVLEGEMRVLTLRTLQSGIGMSEGGGKGGVRKIPALMARLKEKGIEIMDLDVRANNPIRFITPSGAIADGYDAKILPDICAVLIEADRKRLLDRRYQHIADRAATLQHGFATMGIIWLVDKVTGYEDFKKADDFSRLIEAFVGKEMRPYISKFPPKYYELICRLRGIPYDPNSVKRPSYFGHLTNRITYFRLAPGVWKELKGMARKETKVSRPHLHRYLTYDVGDPRLKEIIDADITLMTLCVNTGKSWNDFIHMLNSVLPEFNQTLQLPFNDENDTGIGI